MGESTERAADRVERERLAGELAAEAAYDRGRVDALLDEHTRHLSRINGSIERFANEIETLTQTLTDHQAQRAQAEGEALAVRLALEDAIRKRDAEKRARWSRREKVLALLAAVAVPVVMGGAWVLPHPF